VSETRVWIAQCLCGPNRHAIAAVAGEARDEIDAAAYLLPRLDAGVDRLLRQQGVNPWCAICGAVRSAWCNELGRTRFRTMEEATPHLAETALGNAAASVLYGTHGPNRPGQS
jgi:hypothetical protein